MTRPLRGAPFVAIDFETTGLGRDARWPVSVAVVTGELGRKDSHKVEMATLVKPWSHLCDHIPQQAIDVHGINADMVENAPGIADMLEEMLPLLEGRTPMAYNLPYDWGVLCDCLRLCGAEERPFFGLDPLVWVKAVDRFEKGKGRHKLTAVCARRGIEFLAHDSKNDVLATAEVAPLLLRQLKLQEGLVEELDSLEAFWAWQTGTALADEKRFKAYLMSREDAPETVSCPWHELLGEAQG
jgi:DNA polymerase-3 subunit epsilon